MIRRTLPLLASSLLLVACIATSDAVTDATSDAITDATSDAITDARLDVTGDVASDVTGDVASDAITDATADATADATPDTGPPPRADLAWPPDTEGPYRTGYRSLSVTYQPAGVPEPRTFKLALWYPTTDTEGPDAIYLGIFADDGAIADASLAPPAVGTTYPLHVHSHGHLGYAGASPSLFHHFASHGWVVAAPEHTGNTTLDAKVERPTSMFFLRSFDVSAALDALRDLPATDPLAGHLDTEHVIMSGHSFGGYTTFASVGAAFDMPSIEAGCAQDKGPGGACTAAEIEVFRQGTRDPRVVAAIPMAAGNRAMFGDAGYSHVAVPILMMTGDADTSVPDATEGDPIFAALAGKDVTRVSIAGGCHQVFGIGGCADIADADGFAIVSTYALAFARARLLGDTSVSAILDGSAPVSPAATLTHAAAE
ncbi:MAG: hypothetical protein H6744_12780 [Deltaproteobacteria bacterium]|nr:hypothetical protein [Deltaproteobacteria bacterium]MCB9787548.1 hypothetical protein [Deltaproteobacteria bacterium]